MSSLHFDGEHDFHSEREWFENIEYEKLMFNRRRFLESFMEPEELERQLELEKPTVAMRAKINVDFDHYVTNPDAKDESKPTISEKYFSASFWIINALGLVGAGILALSLLVYAFKNLFVS